ncbi:MAG: hypothetical protein ACRDHW_15780 [Ktedonobacteraceae bacterium]
MATIIERHLIDLTELVEELQEGIETIEIVQYSPVHMCSVAALATAIMEQARQIRCSLKTMTPDYQEAC